MSIVSYIGTWLGVDKITLSVTGGLDAPRMIAASSAGVGSIDVTFDKNMDFTSIWDRGITRILTPGAWAFEDQIGSDVLHCVQVEKISETSVRLYTNFHETTDYKVTIESIKDENGNLINPAFNSAIFTGTAKTYPSNSDLQTFIGMYAGMQAETQASVLPDLFPPQLQNVTPPQSSIEQDQNVVIQFDLVDAESSVDLSTVLIYIEGGLVYRGDTDTFLAPFTGGLNARTPISSGHQFVFDKGASPKYSSYDDITVRVVAYDDPPLGVPNLLDDTYSFRVEDYNAPALALQFPTGTGVDENEHVTFRLTDVGESGVDLDTIDVLINGTYAISSGLPQVGWNGSFSAITVNGFDGYDVVIDNESIWDTWTWYTVQLSVRDNENNLLTDSWTFQSRDYLGPVVEPIDPTLGQMNVDIESDIIIDIYDERGVKDDSILVRFDSGSGYETAFEQGGTPEFKPGYTGTNSSFTPITGGYRLVLDPLSILDYGTTYYVEITALDPDDNPERLP